MQVKELVSISLRDTGSKHSVSIKNKLEKYINNSIKTDLGHIDQYYDKGIFLVAVYGNKIIGSLGGIPESNIELRLKRMSIKKEFRRKGIAKQLLRKIEKWAYKKGFEEMVLGTSEIQKDAVQFWKDSGFILREKEKLIGTQIFSMGFTKTLSVSEFNK